MNSITQNMYALPKWEMQMYDEDVEEEQQNEEQAACGAIAQLPKVLERIGTTVQFASAAGGPMSHSETAPSPCSSADMAEFFPSWRAVAVPSAVEQKASGCRLESPAVVDKEASECCGASGAGKSSRELEEAPATEAAPKCSGVCNVEEMSPNFCWMPSAGRVVMKRSTMTLQTSFFGTPTEVGEWSRLRDVNVRFEPDRLTIEAHDSLGNTKILRCRVGTPHTLDVKSSTYKIDPNGRNVQISLQMFA